MPQNGHDTLIIEDGVIPRRVRRPIDLVRMAASLIAVVAVVAAATILLQTVSGIDRDVADSAAKLPAIVTLLLTAIASLGQVVLPVTLAFDLLSKRRGLLLIEATAAAAAATVVVLAAMYIAREYGSTDLWFALAGTDRRSATPMQPLLAGVFAFVTVARLRGWLNTLATVFLISTLAANSFSGGHTFAAQSINVLLGYAIGLGSRYLFGTPTVRPRGLAIAQLLADGGLPVTVLRATESTRQGRRYTATTTEGKQLQVLVFDRDLEGAGVLPRWWRSLRLRDSDALGGWSMREAIDRSVLMTHAAVAAGASVPRLLLVRSLGPNAAVLASEWIEGVNLADADSVTDAELAAVWHEVTSLHSAGVAHRALSPRHLLLDHDRRVWLLHTQSGAVAMSELQRTIDVANLLVATALVSSPSRALAAAEQEVGAEELLRALPALQAFAMTSDNRRLLRNRKEVLLTLREQIAGLSAGKTLAPVEIERLSPRRMISIVAGLIAAYLLAGQLAQVDVLQLLREANYGWILWGLLLTVLTFLGAAMSLNGFVVEPISLWRSTLAQLAASFATLVSPPALGVVAVNGRYLQREGLPAAAAGATVAVSQALAFFVHVGLMFVAGIAAGTSEDFHFDPPRAVLVGVALVAVLALAALPVPAVRKFVVKVARPRINEIVPRLVTVASRPLKLAEGIGGMLLLNVAFCLALVASVRAFGGGGSIAAISLVYLAGSTLGQAAPTPGGIGAVEAMLTAGLVTAGVDGGVALSAVLLYRLLTFWLPTIPGWLAFQHLTKRGSL